MSLTALATGLLCLAVISCDPLVIDLCPFVGPFSLGLRAILVVDLALVYSLQALVLMPTGPYLFMPTGPLSYAYRPSSFMPMGPQLLLINIDAMSP